MQTRCGNSFDAAHVFEYLAAQQECIDILYGWRSSSSSEPVWLNVSHAEADGLLGLRQIFVEIGLRAKRIGGATNTRAVSPLRSTRSLYLILKRLMDRGSPWRRFDPALRPAPGESARPDTRGFHIFSREETSRFKAVARLRGVSSNSMLLHLLQQAISFELLLDERPSVWMIPVDIRAVAPRSSVAVSCVLAAIESGDTVLSLHRQIHGHLARGEHLALWSLFSSFDPTQLLARMDLPIRPPAITGVFSNFGEWMGECFDGPGAWLACPPVTRFMPFGAGAIVWQGRLGLVMQTHPALRFQQEDIDGFMAEWTARITAGNPVPQWRFLRAMGSREQER